MHHNMFSKLVHIFLALAVFAGAGFVLPKSVEAAAGPSIEIVSVTTNDSVRIRIKNSPANQLFTVRMDKAGKRAVDGIVVAQTNSGAGGTFEETYTIPDELEDVQTIAIRIDSVGGGYFTYNWFTNVTQTVSDSTTGSGTSTTDSNTSTGGRGPAIQIVAVDKNERITVKAVGLPTYTTFNVRVGPFYGFSKTYAIVDTIYTGANSNFEFNVDLPDIVRDVDWVAIRIDSTTGGWFAYNGFRNLNKSTVDDTPGNYSSGTSQNCQITATAPTHVLSVGDHFDAKWTVKNTSDKDWNGAEVDYRYISGTEMQKHDDEYDLGETIDEDDSVTIIVDMVAPGTPGTYTTRWALQGPGLNCSLPLTVVVK
jgi:hypothetical protein